jgi:flavin reductase (DIM6/NTAB) family NADH-FMN oxidoreductase RutF
VTKKTLSPQILLGPVPPALISCGTQTGKNIITLAWVGVVNSIPPLVSISIRPSRYSYRMIMETKEFVINLPTSGQVGLVDGCGTLSGKQVDKFDRFGLTPLPGVLQYAPLIGECPVSMECRVEQSVSLGTHTAFTGLVVAVHADPAVLDEKDRIDFNRCRLLGFCNGQYLETTPLNLKPGYSLKK